MDLQDCTSGMPHASRLRTAVRSRRSTTRRARAAAGLAALTGLLLLAPLACESTASTDPETTDVTTPVVDPSLTPAEALDVTMVIGPTAARSLGYRIEWQAIDLAPAGQSLKKFWVDEESIFALDSRNIVVRLRTSDGGRIWQAPVGSPLDVIYGLIRIADRGPDRLFVTSEGRMFVLDSGTGVQLDVQRLDRVANTPSIRLGRFLVYGTRVGQIVWHQFDVGHTWRANQIDGAIRHAPVEIDGDVVAASIDGDVMMMDGRTSRRLWLKELLAGVTSLPAVGTAPDGRRVVFVAGEDQYLWALDKASGRTVWKAFFQAPLTDGPILIGTQLFQQVPGEGLVCFNAFPTDDVDGDRLWTSSDVLGKVVGRRGENLLVWNEDTRELAMVDSRRGTVRERIALPNVDRIGMTEPQDGDLYASSKDGRLVRLVRP